MTKTAPYILAAYSLISSDSLQHNLSVGYILEDGNPIPSFDEKSLIDLCSEAQRILAKERNVLTIEGDLIVVGDIHGSFHDLLRILNFVEKNNSKVLFLGDFVDRGDFSLECITILLALKVVHPDRYFLIRGNHEFDSLCSKYGFKSEIITLKKSKPLVLEEDQNTCKYQFEHPNTANCYKYSQTLYDAFIRVFSYLPIAAVINKTTFCIHGGLSPKLDLIDDIEELIKRPINDFKNNALFSDLIWSDPSYGSSVLFNESPRGKGYLYNNESVSNFLKRNSLNRMIRAHQCVVSGSATNKGDKCITVFSASSYDNLLNNSSAVLQLFQKEDTFKITTFPPLRRLQKIDAFYYKVQSLNLNNSDAHSCFSLLHPKLYSSGSVRIFTNLGTSIKSEKEPAKKFSQTKLPLLLKSKFITSRRKSSLAPIDIKCEEI
ncbi:hypothetical protein M9Y10_006686 [Tritrichomonas musculus]|uniref:Serine/threonine-protein phosphatase n=1 Tax=Tritrichomonas musculus TaxID=1915356 RepID=A0ABR2JG93_9EUKA